MTTDEAATAFPWYLDYERMNGRFFSRPVGGDSLADVCDRVHMFLREMREQCAGQRVLVVTHGDVARAFRQVLEELDYEDTMTWEPANCAAVSYVYDPAARRMKLAECWAPEGQEAEQPGTAR